MKPSQTRPIFLIIIALLLLISGPLLAKKKNKIPRKTAKSYVLLANYITQNSTSDQEKIDTIYSWITHNIAYDYKKLEENTCFEYQGVNNVLKKKKALCADYSNLMTFMLSEVGIRSQLVEGYTRTENWNDTMNLTRATHAWVAVEINRKWWMLDPTWDAGYIGREHVVYKKPKLKIAKASTKDSKLRKIEYKNKKKVKKYDEKVKNGPLYKGKIKFVFDPKKDWYMASEDSFLLDHLPAVEFWQLRNNPISIDDFVQPKEKAINIITNKSSNGNNYKKEIDQFLAKNQLDRMIAVGDLGFEFNPDNAGIKALNYFNCLSILNNRELKKYFKDAPEELTKPVYGTMLLYVDTVDKYNRLDMANQKANFKLEKKWLKMTYKTTKTSGKVINKKAKIGNKSHHKLIGLIDKADQRIITDNAKLVQQVNKIHVKYPNAKNGDYSKLNLKPVQNWKDSIDLVTKQLDSLISTVKQGQEKSSLQKIHNDVQWVEYYMRVSSEYIGQNNFGLNRFIIDIDSLTIQKLDSIIQLYTLMTQNEVIDKMAMNLIKQSNRYIKMSKAETKIMEQNGEIVSSARYTTYLSSLLLKDITKVYGLFEISKRHHKWIQQNTSFINSIWGKIMNLVDKQEGLNEEKNTFMAEQYEHNHSRDKDLYNLMKKSVKTWKVEFAKKIKEN